MKTIQIKDFLALEPNQIYEWLSSAEANDESEIDMSWLTLGELATSQLYAKTCAEDAEDALSWSKVGVAVYEKLANSTKDKQFEISAMRIRAFIINHFGEQSQPTFNLLFLKQWFYKSVSISLENAIAESKEMKLVLNSGNKFVIESELEKLKKLRLIRSQLYVFKPLKDNNFISETDEINEWLNVFNLLP